MRLVVVCVLCGALMFVVGCQPENGEGNKKSKAEQTHASSATKVAQTSVTPGSQDSPKDSNSPISADKWKRASAKQREEIASRLIAEKKLIGLDEEAVIAALGVPNRRFERILYSFYVEMGSLPDAIPSLMILINRAGTVEKVGSSGFFQDANAAVLPFDKQKWLEGDDYARFGMAPSVWRGDLLKGKKQSQVVELLGEPSKIIPPLLMYKCGLRAAGASGEGPPNEKILSIWFEEGRVVRARLRD